MISRDITLMSAHYLLKSLIQQNLVEIITIDVLLDKWKERSNRNNTITYTYTNSNMQQK